MKIEIDGVPYTIIELDLVEDSTKKPILSDSAIYIAPTSRISGEVLFPLYAVDMSGTTAKAYKWDYGMGRWKHHAKMSDIFAKVFDIEIKTKGYKIKITHNLEC